MAGGFLVDCVKGRFLVSPIVLSAGVLPFKGEYPDLTRDRPRIGTTLAPVTPHYRAL